MITWLLDTIKNTHGYFTLFKLTDIKTRLQKAEKCLNRSYGNCTEVLTTQTDITKMYTNLKHDHILEAIIWLFEKSMRNFRKHKRRCNPAPNFIVMSRSRDPTTNKHHIFWSNSVGDETQITATFDDIYTIVNFDLNHAFQTQGPNVFTQVHGCPIGGFLSAIYANTKCAHDEYRFFQKYRAHKSRIYGIRQMDDLILWIAYHRDKRTSLQEAMHLRKTIIASNSTYTGGLQLETQDFEAVTKYTTTHKFAGTLITVTRQAEGITLTCAPFLKNWASLQDQGRQKFPCFIDNFSYTPDHYKLGVQITTYIRLNGQSSNHNILLDAMYKNALEMYSLGYDSNFLLKALRHLGNTSLFWRRMSFLFATQLDQTHIIVGSYSKYCNQITSLKRALTDIY
jgi:hypothetical protein